MDPSPASATRGQRPEAPEQESSHRVGGREHWAGSGSSAEGDRRWSAASSVGSASAWKLRGPRSEPVIDWCSSPTVNSRVSGPRSARSGSSWTRFVSWNSSTMTCSNRPRQARQPLRRPQHLDGLELQVREVEPGGRPCAPRTGGPPRSRPEGGAGVRGPPVLPGSAASRRPCASAWGYPTSGRLGRAMPWLRRRSCAVGDFPIRYGR